jgi:hypothetical protein
MEEQPYRAREMQLLPRGDDPRTPEARPMEEQTISGEG